MDFFSPLIIISGPACSGKTTFARKLAEKSGRTLLVHDEVLSDFIPESDRNALDRTLACYELHKRAATLLSEGKELVLEGTYSRLEYRTDLARTFADVPIVIIQMKVPVEVSLDRFGTRKDHPGIDLSLERVKELNREYPYFDSLMSIDGTVPFTEQLQQFQTAHTSTAFELARWKLMGLGREASGR